MNIPAAKWKDFAKARGEEVGKSAVGEAVDEAMAGLSSIEAQRRLEAEGVPCLQPMPLDPARLMLDPKLREMGVMVLERQPDYGALWEVGHTQRFSHRTDIRTEATPSLGQHTVSLLKELGKSETEIESLIVKKAVKAAAGRAPMESAKR